MFVSRVIAVLLRYDCCYTMSCNAERSIVHWHGRMGWHVCIVTLRGLGRKIIKYIVHRHGQIGTLVCDLGCWDT